MQRHPQPAEAPSPVAGPVGPVPRPVIVEFDGVTLGYERTPVMTGTTLRVLRGAFVGIVGPSGAGKTTLLRALLGAVPLVRGRVAVQGRQVRPGRPAQGIGYVPQLQTVDWNFPVTAEEVVLLGRAMRSGPWPWPRRKDRADAARLLERLGIGALAKRQIRDLSGGQQQRVFLARALMASPALLLLDEPTSGVDIKTRDEMLHLLADLNAEGTTVLMTTHELNAVAAHLPEVICVNKGVVAQGTPEQVFTSEVLSRTYEAPMQVVRHDGLLLVADSAPHSLHELLHHHHGNGVAHSHEPGSGAPHGPVD